MLTHEAAMHSTPSHDAAKKPHQPLHVAQLDDALLKLQTVRAMTGLSDSTIYRKLAAGDFPQPIRLGTRCTRFRAGDVTAWLRQQAAKGAAQ
ncbi:helix-turn-helix transcriptional regulator [Azohydromonas lata]|uniref:AlpA family phage regulatory protein n=1 Tax=Azohydromonas lata TaxID=45677 RepID=A0ABU5IFI3_9BURK|nr:AlpA family phage regulatory protein [Azohydromonas lata]MDZ5457889.1 AlpA family phage regulatory protein [Azohydromonas lata]